MWAPELACSNSGDKCVLPLVAKKAPPRVGGLGSGVSKATVIVSCCAASCLFQGEFLYLTM